MEIFGDKLDRRSSSIVAADVACETVFYLEEQN